MKVSFHQAYKSIAAGGSAELPKFVVLTGANGSGKTQFLEAIQARKIDATLDADQLSIEFVRAGELNPGNMSQASPAEARELYESIRDFVNLQRVNIAHIDNLEAFIKQFTRRIPKHFNAESSASAFEKIFAYVFESKKDISTSNIASMLTSSEIEGLYHEAFFRVNFSKLFFHYFYDQHCNNFDRYLKSECGRSELNPLDDNEFILLKGRPPWDVVNEILGELDLPYQVSKPMQPDESFTVTLKHINENLEINFTDLSSGEQALCCLAIVLYKFSGKTSFPDLLLLDEPDAHLHPSMTSKMMSVFSNVVLPQLRGGLIVTTHSPTTCALAPQDSLFWMAKDTRRPISKSFDNVSSSLCYGVPSISVSKLNEKQVFTEGNLDADMYSYVWSKFKDDPGCKAGVSLNFIPSGPDRNTGNRGTAIELARRMREAGSSTVHAFVDFDGGIDDCDYIEAVCGGEFYSLENIFLMPHFILLLVMHRNGFDGSSKVLKIFSNTDLSMCSEEDVQDCVSAFCNYVSSVVVERRRENRNFFKDIEFTNENVEVDLKSGFTMVVERWCCESNGHRLQEMYLDVFPELKEYFRENTILKGARNHVISVNMDWLPQSLYNSFLRVSHNGTLV